MNMNWTQEQYDEYLRKNVKRKNNITIPFTNMEQTSSLPPLEKKTDKGLATSGNKYSVVVKSFRHRRADPDGISVKAVLDQLVTAKLLEDDSSKIVEEVVFEQTKIPSNVDEYTIIELWK